MPMQTDYSLAPPAAVEGQISCRLNDCKIDSQFNAEASASIKFGLAVKWGSATDRHAAKLPVAETDKVMGFACRSHSIDSGPRGELDDTNGVKVGGQINTLRVGELWVKVRTGCGPGDRLWVQTTVAGGASRVVGGAENADDGSNTVDCTAQGEFQTFAAAGGLARLRVDFINK